MNIKTLIAVIILVMIFNNVQAQKMNKILVAYFSHSGNTRIIAEYIQKETGGDIFEIKPIKNYPQDYNAVVEQAKKEINSGFMPELKTHIDNLKDYDIIFVGSPNWWSTVAPPVAKFLSSYNFSGKKIIPFITHEGSSFGKSVSDIERLCKNSEILKGYSCRGSQVKKANNEIREWLKKIKIIK